MMHIVNIVVSKVLSLPLLADALGDEIGSKTEDLIKSTTSNGSTGNDAIRDFVQDIADLAIPIGVVASIILFSVAGFKMITSQGNPEKIADAKEVITNAISGFVLIALSVVILLLINDALNLGINP